MPGFAVDGVNDRNSEIDSVNPTVACFDLSLSLRREHAYLEPTTGLAFLRHIRCNGYVELDGRSQYVRLINDATISGKFHATDHRGRYLAADLRKVLSLFNALDNFAQRLADEFFEGNHSSYRLRFLAIQRLSASLTRLASASSIRVPSAKSSARKTSIFWSTSWAHNCLLRGSNVS